jgi:uncharacterized GH25 family protein
MRESLKCDCHYIPFPNSKVFKIDENNIFNGKVVIRRELIEDPTMHCSYSSNNYDDNDFFHLYTTNEKDVEGMTDDYGRVNIEDETVIFE